VKLILEDQQRGKGHAVRTGLKVASGDYVLIQDADLEYDLEDYDALLEQLVAGRCAFVLGSRHGGRNVLKMRQFTGQHGLILFCIQSNINNPIKTVRDWIWAGEDSSWQRRCSKAFSTASIES